VKYLKDDRGVALVLELVLLAIVLTAAGFAGYKYITHKNAAGTVPKPKPHIASPSSSATPNQYAGWQTYTSKTEGLSFRYPPDWTYKNTGSADPSDDGGTFSGPGGLNVAWDSAISSLGGACNPSTDPHVYFRQLTKITSTPDDYILESGKQDSTQNVSVVNQEYDPAIPLRLGDSGTCIYYPLFKSRDGKRNMFLQARVGFNSTNLTPDQISISKEIFMFLKY